MGKEYRQLPTKCPWCGEELTNKNRLLTGDFDGEEVDFGCDKCITRPLDELTVPQDFKYKDLISGPDADPGLREFVEMYRTVFVREEWLSGRISLMKK